MSFLTTILGDPNKRVLRALEDKVALINKKEPEISKLSDTELKGKTLEFKKIYQAGIESGRSEEELLSELMPAAFAVMREAMKRVWGERHFDVQLMGGIVLHQGKIAEMKTGEGKTIAAALALYLNALSGKGAHLITVNDYLSRHQGEGMGEVYNFLGLSTGIIQGNQQTFRFKKNKTYNHYSEVDNSNIEPCSRAEAYACDITYGTNNEYGFDYLRDNMVFALSQQVQRGLHYGIVDEVDSILIDEARTPLIISAPAAESTSLYQRFAALVPQLKEGEHYTVDEKDKVTNLTDLGLAKMEEMLGLKNIYEADGIAMVHHLEEALKAQTLFKKDRDYIVKDGEIIIVDEFTGRLMIGRRYSEGLHQAIEAKEGVEVKRESQTLATISFQNFFRMYDKLAGMTGTAATEAEEFFKIYKLDVVEIPTNRPVIRVDLPDKIYKTRAAKIEAVVADIKERQEKGQPVLVGTVSVSKNEELSKMLRKAGVKHEVLNAKNHDREAKIIMKAGQRGAVTVATNMAGRGTDIKLEKDIVKLGGLHVVGTERHEARRIDNQLRGRSGRQGDPGSSQFYVSLEDDLMRIFGGDRIKNMMNSLGLPDDMPIENRIISRSIESAQKKVEGYNFDVRKHLVEYDDVMNKHREVIYKKRQAILSRVSVDSSGAKSERRLLEGEPATNTFEVAESEQSLKNEILEIVDDEIEAIIQSNIEDEGKAKKELSAIFGDIEIKNLNLEELKKLSRQLYEAREEKFGKEAMREIERAVYLRTIDMLWVEHLTTIDELRTGIGLRGYGQRDPLVEYKQEAYFQFQSLLKSIESGVAKTIYKVEVKVEQPPKIAEKLEYKSPNPDRIGDFPTDEKDLEKVAEEFSKIDNEKTEKESNNNGVITTVRYGGKTAYDRANEITNGSVGPVKNVKKVGRNEPCPCGSGKKYKKCHGR
jgi:preprotein translocase subunit SecA